MSRIEGYYWVRMGNEWYIAEWESRVSEIYYWTMTGSNVPFKNSEFDEIRETRILPPQN